MCLLDYSNPNLFVVREQGYSAVSAEAVSQLLAFVQLMRGLKFVEDVTSFPNRVRKGVFFLLPSDRICDALNCLQWTVGGCGVI